MTTARDDWTNFRLCFAAVPGGGIRRLAGWVRFYNRRWWAKRHICDDASEPAPWVQAKTRAGCVRYLARWTLLDIRLTGDPDALDLSWPTYAAMRAERALKLGGRLDKLTRELREASCA